MNRKIQTHQLLLFALLWSLLSSCQPGPTAVVAPTVEKAVTAPATSTATAEPSSTPVPPTETPLSTSEPTAPLSVGGPWLVYLHSAPPSMMSPEPEHEEFAIIKQDGSGRTLFQLPECYNNVGSFLLDGENTDNFTAKIKRGYYVFRPSQATGMMVFRNQGISACNTFLGGNEQDGMLASLYRSADDAVPELLLYKFPDGKIHNRLPLVKCTGQAKDCQDNPSYWGFVSEQEPHWSPNGRYLAFAAIWDSISSDLYIYDRVEGKLRQLTSGPDWVGKLNWSPDGTQIIMQEIPNDEASSSQKEPSVWSISVSSSTIKMLYPIETFDHHILSWLDDTRYLAYDGDLFGPGSGDAGGVGYNLRFVDTVSGENRILFNGSFVTWSFDKIHETIAIYAIESSEYMQGTYLVSIEKSKVIPVDVYDYYGWDEKTGLFVSEQECESGPQSYRAFDHLGKFSCVSKATSTSIPESTEPTLFPAPNGKAAISLKDGLWLETEGQPAVQISPDEATDVIWCPDSSCVFYSVRRDSAYNLYRVSLPELAIQLVDEGIQTSGTYQWLGGD